MMEATEARDYRVFGASWTSANWVSEKSARHGAARAGGRLPSTASGIADELRVNIGA